MTTPIRTLVVGGGSIGGLISHELTLAHSKQLDLSLMFRNSQSLKVFKRNDSKMIVDRIGKDGSKRRTQSIIKGYTFEEFARQEQSPKIDNLILATKCHKSFSALSPYVNLLHKDSNVIFIQNGMGLMEQLEEEFWPSILLERPNFFKGIVTHGAYKTSPNVINHAGVGNIQLSNFPKNGKEGIERDEVTGVVKLLIDTPNLDVNYLNNYQEFQVKELEKLAVNCCINPLSALFDCFNGDLLEGKGVVKIIKAVLSEFLFVIRKDKADLFRDYPQANSYLEFDRLFGVVTDVIHSTAKNSSSMREDIRNFGGTEIDFINGYICWLAKKHQLRAPTNNMLVWMVKSKGSIEVAIDNRATKLIL